MKKSALLIIAVFCFYAGVPQEVDESLGKNYKKKDLLSVTLKFDNWLNPPADVKTKFFSIGTDVAFQYDVNLWRQRLSVAAGPGIGVDNVRNNASITYARDSSSGWYASVARYPESYGFKANKLVLTYADFSVEIRFRLKEDQFGNQFKFAVGGKAGHLLQAHTKLIDPDKKKLKAYDHPALEKIRYGAYLKAGYGRAYLYGYYSLSTLFESGTGQSPEITPFSFGIGLNPF